MKLAGKFGCEHLFGESEMGPFWLTRQNQSEIDLLDNAGYLQRLNENKLMWYLIPKNYRPLSDLEGTKKGLTAMIVGKGPSLDLLNVEDFMGVDFIIACNEAVFHVCDLADGISIYNTQCDPSAGDCRDDRSVPIVMSNCSHFYAYSDQLFIARIEDFDTPWQPVGCTAIKIAKTMGCSDLILVGFDGAFNGELGYAEVIGKSPIEGKYSDPKRFLSHRKPLLAAIGDTPYTTLTDLAHETLAYDISQQIQEHHGELSEHVHEEQQVEKQETLASLY